ncbi:MAG: glycosyltransferase [Patescibacteria group bacterium]
MKIALVHDWLLGIGGAEKVLKAFHEIFPQAPVYVLFHDPGFTNQFLPGVDIRPTFLQKAYETFNGHKLLAPFLPLAVESIDLAAYDVVISTAQFSKGLILKPKTSHINYCASPTRQVWDWQAEYRQESRAPKSWLALFQHLTRLWDRHASTRVDYYIANSQNTRQRIYKYYHRDATVIYPPIDLPHSPITYHLEPRTYFLIVSRLFKHKNIHLAVKAFSKLEWPLIVIGDGPEKKRLQRLANRSADIVFLGQQPDRVVQEYYNNCLAFVMPQEEDFGIAPIEAMSCGKPVLALKKGGALEYIEEGINGEFFEDPCEEMLANGARQLKENLPSYNPEQIKRTAERFGKERFKKEINEILGIWTSNFSDVIDSRAEALRQ